MPLHLLVTFEFAPQSSLFQRQCGRILLYCNNHTPK
jgi:hypothetical protein